MSRPRSSSVTRRKFSHCALVEILHLHDCLRGALFDILTEVNSLVKTSENIDNEIGSNNRNNNDNENTDGNDSDAPISSTISCSSTSSISSVSSTSSQRTAQHVDTKKTDTFEVLKAATISSQVASRFHLIWSVFQAHSGAEDEFIFPALKLKVAEQQANDPCVKAPEGSCACTKSLFGQHEYEEDHEEEEIMFKQINSTLRRLLGSFRYYHVSHNQTSQSREKALYIIRQVILLLKQQMDNLVQHLFEHLEKEETECLPIVKQLLSDTEIRTLVGKIMGKRSAEMMTKILNLALCSLPAEERADMVAHMKKATTGTYFEKWLDMGGWKNGEDRQLKSSSSPSASPMGPRALSVTNLKRRIPTLTGISDDAPKKLRKITSSQANLCQMNMDRNSRSRHPSRWYKEDDDGYVALVWCSADPESIDPEVLPTVPVFTQAELTPTYHFSSAQGGPVLGCDHYARACKLRHPETGTLHTCRLCCQEQREAHTLQNSAQHSYCQEVSQPPVLNRNEVSEILCMRCGALQPVGTSCINPDCVPETRFAKHVCKLCRLYDDAPSKDIYHCPYCNTCRKGKGLDIDFQHCMTCNACIAIEEFEGHKCIPQRLEGNCPICQEEMKDSTVPLRGMSCGHVMHLNCFDRYIASCGTSRKIKCPHCNVGFDNLRG